MQWSVSYERAILDDGSLLFPEKLSQEFLDQAKRTMGSYLFANQYLNEIIPIDLQTFKKDWFKYYQALPKIYKTFMFVDPALSQADTADFTGVVVIHVDSDKEWYVRYAKRYKITPTQLINQIFELYKAFKPNVIGIEAVAYQKALLYFLDEEMRRRGVLLPVTPVTYSSDKSKQTRILSLVPRFEFGHIMFAQGLQDLELELLKFPRGAHDDLIDALAGMEYIYSIPEKPKEWEKKPAPNHPNYEKWLIEQRFRRKHEEENGSYG